VRRNLGPVDRRTLFIPSRNFFNQAQRIPRARTGGRNRKKYNLTEKGNPDIG